MTDVARPRPATVIDSLDALAVAWPDLRDCALVELDLRGARFDWRAARMRGAMLLGCLLAEPDVGTVVAQGGVFLGPFDDLPFTPYRSSLYSYRELAVVQHGATGSATLDERVGAWFHPTSVSLRDAVARSLHDATIEGALTRFVGGRRMVGVMGGHAVRRDAPLYRRVAEVGRALTRAGYCVATGGGPGVMEAANLGAWFAPFTDDALDAALAVLATAPLYDDAADAYIGRALDVRDRWRDGGESLGVPTWVYLAEPTSAFATHIAKFFTNSVREDGLLAIARSGVVYAPGGAGTEQEIFTDAAQNSLTLYEVRSPMVFLGRSFFEEERGGLLHSLRRQAAAFGWDHLVTVCDDAREVVAFLDANAPGDAAAATVMRRRTHKVR